MEDIKRKRADSASPLYTNKVRSRPSAEARVDPTYGQRSAIPGLDDEVEEGEDGELNYEEGGDVDALSYLRAVRQEATRIPNLLVAPATTRESHDDRDIYRDGTGDFRGTYEDGAYFASTEPEGTMEKEGQDTQIAYFDSILSRFEILRAQLQQTPPREAIERLTDKQPTHVGTLNLKLAKWWRWSLRTVDPVPVQVACMNKSSVLRLLGLLTAGTALKRGVEVDVAVSRWAWGLLAKLPARGELTSEEIGVVRELGKKAVLVGMGLKEDAAWEDGMKEVERGFDGDGDEQHEENEDVVEYEVENELGGGPEEGLDEEALESASPILLESTMPEEISMEPLEKRQRLNATRIRDLVDKELISPESSVEQDIAADESSLAATKAQLLSRLAAVSEEEPKSTDSPSLSEAVPAIEKASDPRSDSAPSKWNTRATVDMIITVAGEMYGQRDLLEFRSVWGDVS